LERVGSFEQAQRNLDGLLRNHKAAALGQHPFASLVNVKPDTIQFEAIEKQMLAAVQPEVSQRYGIAVEFLGIRKLGLPESITEKVFARMKAERQEIAERFRAEGEAEATKIRAQADSQRDQTLAKAEAEAKRLRADGDAKAAAYYQVFEKDPALAMFLRKLEVMEETLKEKSTVVLSADTPPYDLLRGTESLPKKK
jgi:membrane protease subunit HflC